MRRLDARQLFGDSDAYQWNLLYIRDALNGQIDTAA